MERWDKFFFTVMEAARAMSKDSSTKVGAIIASPDRRVISMGYNGLPRGVYDDDPSRDERPQKYLWYEHAERNAIYNAREPLAGATIYVPWTPCADCARGIIQVGIKEVVMLYEHPARWAESCDVSIIMFNEADVSWRYHYNETLPENHHEPYTLV